MAQDPKSPGISQNAGEPPLLKKVRTSENKSQSGENSQNYLSKQKDACLPPSNQTDIQEPIIDISYDKHEKGKKFKPGIKTVKNPEDFKDSRQCDGILKSVVNYLRKLFETKQTATQYESLEDEDTEELPLVPKVLKIGQKKFLELSNSSFQSVIDQWGAISFIDKSLLIQFVLGRRSKVALLYPQRWGKSLNLSMLEYFFCITKSSITNRAVFSEMKIGKADRGTELIDNHYGKYAVIKYDLGHVITTLGKETMLDTLKLQIRLAYEKFSSILGSSNEYQQQLTTLKSQDCSGSTILGATMILTQELKKKGFKSLLFIDEYDTPFNALKNATSDKKDMKDFLNAFIAFITKGNENLERVILTGIFPMYLAELESASNDIIILNGFDPSVSDHYGFSSSEIETMLKEVFQPEEIQVKEIIDNLTRFYNGYYESKINPWAVMNHINKMSERKSICRCESYWSGTNGAGYLKIFLEDSQFRDELLKLLVNSKPLCREIKASITSEDLERDFENRWSILFYCGYLSSFPTPGRTPTKTQFMSLIVPNREVRFELLDQIIWYYKKNPQPKDTELLSKAVTYLQNNDLKSLFESIGEFIKNYFSYYEMTKEKHYQIALHMFFSLMPDTIWEKHIEVISSIGRADVVLSPIKPDNEYGYIFELKYGETEKNKEGLGKKLAKTAREQANTKEYWRIFAQKWIKKDKIILVGVGCVSKTLYLNQISLNEMKSNQRQR